MVVFVGRDYAKRLLIDIILRICLLLPVGSILLSGGLFCFAGFGIAENNTKATHRSKDRPHADVFGEQTLTFRSFINSRKIRPRFYRRDAQQLHQTPK